MIRTHFARKVALAFVATLTAVAGLATFGPGASAASNYSQVRYDGVDRFDTAALIASAIAEATPTAILARADIFPDALTGTFAAAANEQGPLLLTRSDAVPARTMQALEAENVDKVILLGGASAINDSVRAQLVAAGYTVERLEGQTRYHTAIRIAQDGAPIIGTVEGRRAALISNGLNFPDALAGAPLSFAAGLPSLLTPPNYPGTAADQGAFNDVVNALNGLNIEHLYVLGGPAAVSQSVEDELRARGFGTSRLAGDNRSGTSVDIFEFGLANDIYTNRRFGLARGDAFPDALAYGPLGGRPRTSPAPQSGEADTGGDANGLLLAASHCTLSDEVENFLLAHDDTWTEGEILGGPAAICEAVADEVEAAADTEPVQAEGDVTLSPTSGASGSEVTANYEGDRPGQVSDVSSSNCTITNEQQDGVDRTFTITGDPDEACTVTTTVTFTDDEGGTDTFTDTFTITGQAGAATATVRPELETATLGATSAEGTLITYCFDEEITGANTPDAALFHVYTFNGDTQYDGDDDGTPNPLITTNNCVQVNFEAITTASNLRDTLSVATVDFGAVQDNEGSENPIGDAPLGSGQQVNLTAGQTAAPDLISVTGCAAEPGGDADAVAETRCTFTFDEKAYTAQQGGFHLVLLTGEQIDCVALAGVEGGQPADPAIADADNSIVTECQQTATSGTITTAAVARGFVDENTVSDAVQDKGSRAADTGGAGVNGGGGTFVATEGCDPTLPLGDPADECVGNLNPLQATDTPDAQSPGTPEPDLVSVTLTPGDATFDSITYTFDETVQANPILAGFCFYDANGDQTCAAPGDTAIRGNPADETVVVTFADGALDQAVGASVLDSTVRDINSNPNDEDEEGMANANQSATSAGRTDNPDLTGVAIATGNAQFRATYTFDEDLDQSSLSGSEATQDPLGNPGNFSLFAADGTRYVATACETRTAGEGSPAGTESTDNTVVCTAYAIAAANGTSTGVVPTNLALFNSVVGTVDDGAVTEEGVSNGSNPEGAELTTGGVGTPAE